MNTASTLTLAIICLTTSTHWATAYILPHINHPTTNKLTTWLGYK